jgi:predicted permease
MDTLQQDLRYAVRQLRKSPGFTAVAVLVIALGIGACTAVFSIANPLLVRELPFADASELTWITHSSGTGLSGTTYPVDVFEEMRASVQSFEEIAPYFAFFSYLSYRLTGVGTPERLSAVDVGPRFLEMLGVQPAHGRLFTAEELTPNGPKAALLTHALWQRRFAADPSLVGQSVTINEQPYTVVGVLPASFDFASVFAPGAEVDLFVPAVLDNMRTWGNTLSIVGRLKDGVSLATARAELAEVMRRIGQTRNGNYERGTSVTTLKEHVSGHLTSAVTMLSAAVGLVLLIVCANLSNLLLARASARQREIAMRMAIGAKRVRVIRQLLTEGVVLTAVGATLGVAFAYALTGWLRSSAGLSLPLLESMHVDGAALLFTTVTAIGAGLASGVLPALRVSSRNPQDTLKDQGRGMTDGRGIAWVRSTLVVSEVALASVLLVGAGLLLQSLLRVNDIDLGFQPSRAVAVRIDLNSTLTPAQRSAELDRVLGSVRTMPGVDAAGLSDALPLDRNRAWDIRALGEEQRLSRPVGAFVYVVSPDYFRAMGIPLINGRDFSADDLANRPRVLIVNETLARTLWPDQNAIGRLATTNGDAANPLTVVAVVADVRQSSLEAEPGPQMYVAYAQAGGLETDLVVRSALPPETLAASLRARKAEIEPAFAGAEVRPLDALVDRASSARRFLVLLIGAFSALALVLACVGIYGVVSYGVSQRQQEFALRMAIGATGTDLCRDVLTATARLASVGLAVGLLASLGLGRLIEALLFNTSPGDTTAFASTALLLMVVAMVAGAVPAIRASRANPIAALRGD